MKRRQFLIVVSLVFAIAIFSTGFDQGVWAANNDGSVGSATQNNGKTKSTAPSTSKKKKKGNLSKRNQARVEQAEQARLRREKIKKEIQDNNAETGMAPIAR